MKYMKVHLSNEYRQLLPYICDFLVLQDNLCIDLLDLLSNFGENWYTDTLVCADKFHGCITTISSFYDILCPFKIILLMGSHFLVEETEMPRLLTNFFRMK